MANKKRNIMTTMDLAAWEISYLYYCYPKLSADGEDKERVDKAAHEIDFKTDEAKIYRAGFMDAVACTRYTLNQELDQMESNASDHTRYTEWVISDKR
jgi:hypothetical protein